MWGSSFADLAKRAQELQEQASHISTGEFFNLDAIQSMTDAQKKEREKQEEAAADSQEQAQTASFQLPSSTGEEPSFSAPKPQVVPKGKLKIPTKESELGPLKETNDESVIETSPAPESPNALDEASEQQKAAETTPVDDEGNPIQQPSQENNEEVQPDSTVRSDSESPSADGKQGAVEDCEETNGHGAELTPGHDGMLEEATVPSQENLEADQSNNVESNGFQDNKEMPSMPTDDSSVENQIEDRIDKTPATDEESNKAELEVEQTDQTSKIHQIETNAASFTEEEEQSDGIIGETNIPDATAADASVTAVAENSMPPGGSNGVFPQSEPPDSSSMVDKSEQARQEIVTQPDSEQVMENFTLQLQRLEENFQIERQETERQHAAALQQAVASKDEEMKNIQRQLQEKEKKVRELLRTKEGNDLRMDSLQREVEGTKELLQKKEVEIKRINEENLQNLRKMERKFMNEEKEHEKTKEEVKSLKDELLNSKGALGATTDEYSNLKERVKVIAGELKERRAECRDLKNKVEEMTQVNESLEEQVSNLQSQLKDRDLSRTEQDEQVDRLRSTIEDLQQKIKEGEESIVAKEAEGEKALATYKKKAQNSLAVANSRAAAAVQAKEEAELEARAARSTADTAMKRAEAAEANAQDAMVKAKAYYSQMEEEKDRAVAELETAKSELKEVQSKLEELTASANRTSSEKSTLLVEKSQLNQELESERSKNKTLERELTGTRARADALSDNVDELRVQLQKAEKAAATAAKSGGPKADEETPSQANVDAPENSNSKATIIMLQNQLNEANQAIDELKEALQNAIAMNERSDGSGAPPGTLSQSQPNVPGGFSNGGNESTPLFYAMEKQAELNTARNEINRLASLYADVQSEKHEAQEALEALRRELNEERAKLERHEKLGSTDGSSAPPDSAVGDDNRGQGGGNSDKGRMNVEYLKNIMLSFLNAKTMAERKALVPVIGAVLCLTPDEQAAAIKNVESAGGIEGVSNALFESLGSRVLRK